MDTDSEEDLELTAALVVAGAVQATQNHDPIRPNILLSGKSYVDDLLTSAHLQRCFEVLRMSLTSFFALREWLISYTSLQNLRKHKGLSVREKLVIFLYITARNASIRDCCERFNHSGRTISKLVLIISQILEYKLIYTIELSMTFLL